MTIRTRENTKNLPLLPLKNSALFPHLLMPLSVGRPASLAAVEAAQATEGREIVVAAQRDASIEAPGLGDLLRSRNQGGRQAHDAVFRGRHGVDRPGCRARQYPWAGAGGALPESRRAGAAAARRCWAGGRGAAPRSHGAGGQGHSTGAAPSSPGAQPAVGQRRGSAAAGLSAGLHVRPGCRQGAGVAGGRDARRCAAPDAFLPGARASGARAARQDRFDGADRNGQGAARVLPAPAVAGHPAGAGREEPRAGRGRSAQGAPGQDGPPRGCPQGSRARAVSPGAAAQQRSRLPRPAHLPGSGAGAALESGHGRSARHRARRVRFWTRITST